MQDSYSVNLGFLREALVKIAIREGWQYKYAKFGKQGRSTQSLFVHSINTFSLAQILSKLLFNLSPQESLLSSVAAFFHDYQKANEKWQRAAIDFIEGRSTSNRDFAHDSGSLAMLAELRRMLEKVDVLAGTDLASQSERILRIVVYTHDAINSAAALKRKQEVGSLDTLTKVVRLCDSIASIKNAEDIKTKERDPDIPSGKQVVFEHHSVSVIRGVISSFLNEAAVELMRELGYTPLLHFGSSTAYIRIGEGITLKNPKERMKQLLLEQFRKFQDSDIYGRGMVKAVVGPLPATKWPAIHLIREDDVRVILGDISSQPFANKDEAFGKQYFEESAEKDAKKGDSGNVDALRHFVKVTRSTSQDVIIAAMVSDFNLLVYVADFVKRYSELVECANMSNEYTKNVNSWLSKDLGDFILDDIKGISHTTPASERVRVVEKLWRIGNGDLHKSADRREQILQNSIRLLVRIIKEYRDFAPPLIEDEVVTELLSDIQYIPVNLSSGNDVRELSTKISNRYQQGKSSADRLCSFCSLTSIADAPAGLFGDGSEKFSNTLQGGVRIGSKRKAQVCNLCMLEGTLRAFFFGSPPFGTMLLLPDLSLSPDGFRIWSNAVKDTIRSEHIGLGIGRSWNMLKVYEHLSSGKTLDSSSELMRMLMPTKGEIAALAEHLSQLREFPDEVGYTALLESGVPESFETLARAHIENLIEIDPHIMESFEPKYRSQRSSCFTASHVITFLKDAPSESKDEAPSTSALRLYLMALVLSDIFHARVVFINGYQPFLQTAIEGMVSVDMPAPAEIALTNLGFGHTINLHEMPSALRRLSSLIRIGMTYTKGLGKDRLLRLSSMNRGAILRRVETEGGTKMKSREKQLLLALLENMPVKAGDKWTTEVI
jgi:hypothetical protein